MGNSSGKQSVKNNVSLCFCRASIGRCCCILRLVNDNNRRWFSTFVKTISGCKTKRFRPDHRAHYPEVGIYKFIVIIELGYLRLNYACRRLVYMPLNGALVEIILHRISIVPYRLRLFGLINFAISPYFC